MTDPTEEIAETPVSAKETSDLPPGVPTEDAKEIPVKLAIVSWVVVVVVGAVFLLFANNITGWCWVKKILLKKVLIKQ